MAGERTAAYALSDSALVSALRGIIGEVRDDQADIIREAARRLIYAGDRIRGLTPPTAPQAEAGNG